MRMIANSSDALIIFTKNPELGKVKTRLAQGIGNEAALAAYISLLAHTKEVVLQSSAKTYLFYDQYIPEDNGSSDLFIKKLQHPGDLGERIQHAFSEVFKNQHSKVIIIGSDCPDISPKIISDAFKALELNEFCIGPTEDKGYYLLGMKEMYTFPFENISWSTDQVLPQTINKLKAQGKTYTLLPELFDVDYEKEWKRSHLYKKES